jgi:hypothetical protein
MVRERGGVKRRGGLVFGNGILGMWGREMCVFLLRAWPPQLFVSGSAIGDLGTVFTARGMRVVRGSKGVKVEMRLIECDISSRRFKRKRIAKNNYTNYYYMDNEYSIY